MDVYMYVGVLVLRRCGRNQAGVLVCLRLASFLAIIAYLIVQFMFYHQGLGMDLHQRMK